MAFRWGLTHPFEFYLFPEAERAYMIEYLATKDKMRAVDDDEARRAAEARAKRPGKGSPASRGFRGRRR